MVDVLLWLYVSLIVVTDYVELNVVLYYYCFCATSFYCFIVVSAAVKLTYVSVYGICYHGHVGVLLLYSEA